MLYRDALSRAATTLAQAYPDADPTLAPLNNDTPERESFVFRADLGEQGRAIVKVAAPHRLTASANRLAATHPQMNDGRFRVPKPLHHDAAAGVLITEDARGDLAQTLWLKGGAEANRALQSAGGWIARYHGISAHRAPFNPDPHLNWLRKSLAAHQTGSRRIPDHTELAAHLPQLEILAEAARTSHSIRCVTHRDFHLRNLVIRKLGRCYGFDFENESRDEAMRDQLFLLIDAARLDPTDPTPDSLRAIAQALRQTYGKPAADPAARIFFQRCVALNAWAAQNEASNPTGPKRQRLLAVLRATAAADDLFAD